MNEIQQYPVAYGSQLAPQGFFGGLIGAPLGGLIGRGIGGLFGNAGMGSHIGQLAGGIGGAILPFSVDPVTAAYAQQAQQQQQMQALQGQLAPQGFFGNLLGAVGQPLGGAIGGLFGHSGIGNTIGGVASQLGRILPFSSDPLTAAYAQQAQQQQLQQQLLQQAQQAQLAQQMGQQGQIAPQGWFGNVLSQVGQPLGGAIGGLFGQSGIGNAIGGVASQLGSILPFSADPVSQLYAQQAQQAQQQQLRQLQQAQLQQAQLAQQVGQQGQFAPQGWFGNLIGQVGQPLGSAIGGLFGNAGLGGSIGGVASQIGRILPFAADPVTLAYAQQQQQQQQQQLQQLQQQVQQQQLQQHLQQQAQLAQQVNGYYPGMQAGGQGIGAQGGYVGQASTLH
ncbi:MAG: hypothetical protein V4582_00025 [Pseudomonadota bacterium]